MEETISYPDNPANFMIKLQNLNASFSAPDLDVKVNLSIYSFTTNNVNYSLILPPYISPINTTYIDAPYTRVNFTVVDRTLYFGEGLVLNGFLNTTKAGIIIHYVWTLIVDGKILYTSPDTSPENRILVE